MTHKNERVLSVAELARMEGEGALYVRARGDRVEEAPLDMLTFGVDGQDL
jgi:sulfhydrogenase subunit alpha